MLYHVDMINLKVPFQLLNNDFEMKSLFQYYLCFLPGWGVGGLGGYSTQSYNICQH